MCLASTYSSFSMTFPLVHTECSRNSTSSSEDSFSLLARDLFEVPPCEGKGSGMIVNERIIKLTRFKSLDMMQVAHRHVHNTLAFFFFFSMVFLAALFATALPFALALALPFAFFGTVSAGEAAVANQSINLRAAI